VSGERTEAPTQRRLDEARRKGQGVGRSHELTQVLTLVAGLLMLSALLPAAGAKISSVIVRELDALAQGPATPSTALTGDLGNAISLAVGIILPLAAAVAVAGIMGSIAGGGLILSAGSIRFDTSRLNPIKGLGRLVDKTALTRLGISVAKLAILAAVSYQVIINKVPAILSMDGQGGSVVAGRALSAIFELGVSIAILLAAVALADWIIQRRRAAGSLKMTRDEVKREYKEQEGDPLVRAQRRQRARRLAFSRMMEAVATADVIVTNPTRLAVALKYDPKTMRAPKIVAKGQRLMAARIRELARKHNVPIIEDKPLARALYPRPVGAEVPAHLYKAVARILVLVARIRAGKAQAISRRRPTTAAGITLPSWFEGTAR
jgi:flagellar biosynthesis protein FlhB